MMRFVVLAMLFNALAEASQPGRLCAASETNYFSCRMGDGKWLSLCGTPAGTLQYRYGTVGRLALRYPNDMNAGANRFMFAHYRRYQTDRVEIEFHNLGIDYTLFDYREGAKRHAGVRVGEPNGKESERSCTGRIASRLIELQTILPCSTDNALNGGRCQ